MIYSADERHRKLRNLFITPEASVSLISKLEVLGYHAITAQQIRYFSSVFQILNILPNTTDLIEAAILLRRKKSMSVGDSIIAATAKFYHCELYTHNVGDFKNLPDIRIVDPLGK